MENLQCGSQNHRNLDIFDLHKISAEAEQFQMLGMKNESLLYFHLIFQNG